MRTMNDIDTNITDVLLVPCRGSQYKENKYKSIDDTLSNSSLTLHCVPSIPIYRHLERHGNVLEKVDRSMKVEFFQFGILLHFFRIFLFFLSPSIKT